MFGVTADGPQVVAVLHHDDRGTVEAKQQPCPTSLTPAADRFGVQEPVTDEAGERMSRGRPLLA